jgi:hypothetical protein
MWQTRAPALHQLPQRSPRRFAAVQRCRQTSRAMPGLYPQEGKIMNTDVRFTRAMEARMTVRNEGPCCMRPCTECDRRTQAVMRRNRFQMFMEAQRRNARWQ